MTSSPDPVFVFDLDGTVLSRNSFPLWLRFMLLSGEAAWPRRAVAVAALMAAIVERKLLRRKHHHFKARLQRIWSWAAPETRDSSASAFSTSLLAHRRDCLDPLLRRVAAREIDAILATAAAEEYAVALGQMLGFGHVLATPVGMAATAENIGEEKEARVLDLMRALDWSHRQMVVVTDHIDDLPLIRGAAALVWCGPAGAAAAVRTLLPGLPILCAEACSAPDVESFAFRSWSMVNSA